MAATYSGCNYVHNPNPDPNPNPNPNSNPNPSPNSNPTPNQAINLRVAVTYSGCNYAYYRHRTVYYRHSTMCTTGNLLAASELPQLADELGRLEGLQVITLVIKVSFK